MSSDNEEANKRQRVSRACDLCRRKKIKCDGLILYVVIVKHLIYKCSYKDTTKKRGPPKGYIEAIENRLYKLEKVLSDLAQGDDPKAKQLMNELNAPLETPTGEQITSKPQRRSTNPSERNRVFFWQNAPIRSKNSNKNSGNDISTIINNEHHSPTMAGCIFDSTEQTNKNNDNNNDEEQKKTTTHSALNYMDSTGQLAMDADGEYRYLGKSSGFYLLQKSRTYHHGAFHLSNVNNDNNNNSNNNNNNNTNKVITISPSHNPYSQHFMKRVPSTSSSSSSSAAATPLVDPTELPSPELSSKLVGAYFNYFYPFLPIFYKHQLSSTLEDASEPISPLLLNAIYALASRVVDDVRVRSDPTKPETAGDVYFERAKFLLDSYYDKPKISTVQALLLLSSHQQGMRKSARAWLYSGMAFRMALDLGLNRNCDHWQIPHDEKERRKRIFWCCFVVDRLASATFGRTSCFEESDCDVPFPAEEDDSPVYTSAVPNTDYAPPGPLLVLDHLVKVCDILGHVLKNIYYAKSLQQADMRYIDHLVHTLTGRLTHWYKSLPSSLCIDINNVENRRYPLSVYQLHMVYHTTVILLHRLFIPNNANDVSTSSMIDYNICAESATCIMKIANSMLNSNVLKYVSNTTVYFVFTAGIIFINSATSKNNPGKSFDAKININNIMRILNTMASTWPSALRGVGILGELAGIHDLNLPTSENTLRPIVNNTINTPTATTTSSLASSPSNSPTTNSKMMIDYNSFNQIKQLKDSKEKKYWVQDSAVRSSSKDHSDFQNMNNHNNHNINHNNNINNHDIKLSTSSQSVQSPSILQQNFTKGNMDPFAAPDTIPIPSQRQFDPLSAAFWGVPQSLDLNEWNNYLGSQLPTYQQQQQSNHFTITPSTNGEDGGGTVGGETMTHQPSSSSSTSSSSSHLIPTRNISNFGNNVSLKPTSSSISSTSNLFNSVLQSDLSSSSSVYNRSPTTLTTSSISTSNPTTNASTITNQYGSSSSITKYPQNLIHGDSNVDILSGVSIPLDIPNVSTSNSAFFGFLSDRTSGLPLQSNTSSPSLSETSHPVLNNSNHQQNNSNNNIHSTENQNNSNNNNNKNSIDSTLYSSIIF
ncbi:unnamed protein product [Cunninghamella echinulata]